MSRFPAPHSFIGIQPAPLHHTGQAVGINHIALWNGTPIAVLRATPAPCAAGVVGHQLRARVV
jgi:hypothetical protein